MKFSPTPLADSLIIEPTLKEDSRGYFARLFCSEEFKKQGIDSNFVQVNHSFNTHKGTLRGLHYQLAPKSETKMIRCVQGSIWDVILDLRPDSKTFGQWYGEILSAENKKMMLVPKGCAHGFLTLTPNSELIYLASSPYDPSLEKGVRWDDPKFLIEWPELPKIISKRDQTHPHFS